MGEEIFHQYGSLLADGRAGAASGQAAGVSKGEDVWEAGVLEGEFIHLNPASVVGKGAEADEVRRAHWRSDMEQIEGNGAPLLGCNVLDNRFAGLAVHLSQVRMEKSFDATGGNDFFQSVPVFIDAENCRPWSHI